MNNQGTRRLLTGLVLVLGLGWGPVAGAQSTGAVPLAISGQNRAMSVDVAIDKSKVLDFPHPVKILSVGNPDVADIVVVRSGQIYVLGKSLGNTNVVLWDRSDRVQGSLNIEVTPDMESLKADLHELLPDESVQVRAANGRLILSGEVSSAERMDTALRLAESYVPGSQGKGDKDSSPILNMMQVGGAQQVMLEVKVAEVTRSLVKRLESQFNVFNIVGSSLRLGAVKGGATFPDALFNGAGGQDRVPALTAGNPLGTPTAPVIDEFAPSTATIEDAGIFASYQRGDYLLNLVLDAANRQGVAKILAEPNLTTLTGQEATFLAGGEFPIPVPQGDGKVTIDYKDFGVGLNFVPVVLDSGVINLKVGVAVSDLVSDNSLTVAPSGASSQFFVPALVKRSASSTLELGNGQTIAIAGMLNENLRQNVSKLPGLGDLPVLGALFRSQEFIKDQTELVIFVTPRLARPMAPDQVHLPTGSFVAPSDVDFYLLGRLGGRPEAPASRSGGESVDPLLNRRDGGTEGRFGHDL
ncbi:type II and III secretion system protein family protein [Modicisalibacter tunisiensis]|uniref:type II and III secretion system protein family protein n=1 Tax=Modicisalibacter tunisiensis TaxID=390637 RepID=UPI001CCB8F29|nr:type II and III secretion system protein family protein [Modicisalibacter tunisiensis]MBZ9539058.1 type II and III secretion system protein family protein [Modicisalibacter tunisiensis]